MRLQGVNDWTFRKNNKSINKIIGKSKILMA